MSTPSLVEQHFVYFLGQVDEKKWEEMRRMHLLMSSLPANWSRDTHWRNRGYVLFFNSGIKWEEDDHICYPLKLARRYPGNSSVMRVTGTSSAQTAGCGSTEIQQGLPVDQDYQLRRITFTHTGWVLIQRLPYRNGPAAISTTKYCDRLQPFVGYRELSVIERIASYRITSCKELPVSEKSAVPTITGKKAASNQVLTPGSLVTEISRLQRITGEKLGGKPLQKKISSANWSQRL